MASNKFVIKCGNFAVLVDVHILPQGSSKDTSWFSDHEKENVCMLLEEVVASRVKQYLEAPKQRGQWKSMEHAPSGPLFLTDMQHFETRMPKIPFCLLLSLYVAANSLHITAYFMKRWVNLRCAVGRHYRDLRVFPDRFIVCISKLDCNPSDWTCDNDVLKEELSNGTSEYFTESAESKKAEISPNEQIKQGILKEIVKRTKMKKSNANKPQISKDSKVSVGSVELQTGNRKNDRQTSLSPQSEVTCRSPGLLKDCTNTIESNLELPVLKLENYVNQRQPDGVSSQQKPQSLEWLKSSHLRENLPCSSETALLDPKRSQKMTKTQTQQKTCAPEEKLEYFEKVCSEGTPLIPSNTEISKHNDGCLGPFLEEKTPLNSELFSKRDMTKAASGEESLRKNPSQPLTVRNNIAQTSQNEPSTTTENAMPPSYIELQPVPSEKLSQKRKKEVENGLRKLKLRRLKKS